MDEPAPLFPRPMSPFAAIGWTLAVTALLILFAQTAASLRGGDADLVTVGACEIAAYLLVLFAILRAHAPDASIRAFCALRGTHALFFPLGLFLGITLCALTTVVGTLLMKRFPTGHEGEVGAAILGSSPATRAALFALIVVVGPLVEELFYRGAIVQGLRKTQPLLTVVVISGATFGLAHALVGWQVVATMSLVGVAMGYVRVASGSLFPTLLVHAGHNAMSFAALFLAANKGDLDDAKLLPLGALGVLGTAILLQLARVIGRTHAATDARAADTAAV